ncbi:MAG: transposase [Saprospiraceae bacterium]
MKITQSGRKQYTVEEKLKIIEEIRENGVRLTCSKYGIYPGSYYYWKRQLLTQSEQGLVRSYNKATKSKVKLLEKQVETLKLLLAKEKLESRLKDDLLKKKYPELRK